MVFNKTSVRVLLNLQPLGMELEISDNDKMWVIENTKALYKALVGVMIDELQQFKVEIAKAILELQTAEMKVMQNKVKTAGATTTPPEIYG